MLCIHLSIYRISEQTSSNWQPKQATDANSKLANLQLQAWKLSEKKFGGTGINYIQKIKTESVSNILPLKDLQKSADFLKQVI